MIEDVLNGTKDWEVLQGSALDTLKLLPDNSVQCCVTSPPYFGLRAYNTTPQIWGGDVDCDHEWEAVSPRRTRTLDDVKDEDSAQNKNEGANCELLPTRGCSKCDAWEGELGQEPIPEMFIDHLASIFDQVKRVLKGDGVFWINIGDTYWKEDKIKHQYLKSKDLCMVPHRLAIELQRRGWWVRQDLVWEKPAPMPESCQDRCTRAHEYIFLCSKNSSYYYDKVAISEDAIHSGASTSFGNKNSAAHMVDELTGNMKVGAKYKTDSKRNRRSIWRLNVSHYSEAHFATFPQELPRLAILAGSKIGDIVLDCFNGAGTSGIVAVRNGRRYIGCELNPEYVKLTEKRMNCGSGELFG